MDQLSTIILGASLFIIMLGMGLSLVTDDFKRVLVYPKAVIVGLVSQLILLPIIGYGVASLFDVRPEIAVGIMILAACPGGPTSNLIAHMAKGNTALSVTLTAFSSFITILTIPFIVNFALEKFMGQSEFIKLDVIQTILQVMVIIIIPIVIGMMIRKYKTAFAMKMEKPVRIASGVVIMLVIVGLCVKEKDNMIPYLQEAGLVSLVLNVVTMFVGYRIAKLFSLNDKSAVSIAIESGIQNGTLAISIAIVLLNNSEFAIAPAVYGLLMFLTGGVVIYWSSRKFARYKSN
ncbi:bile acid:sodium symporter family protein [Roseivirga sp. E12]|uniref:bile acid:sodium symporter family protein n=1 Tax=Roseivirga sp. E12 TaxID=2819237 RepID=UPI001ABCB019|nr:bile acid:sodium symporter family protein [Roseivirga sp. E12]MBO3696814.1 bile acid:sodium symporter family protein [Roseivirga sp. E12]